LEITIKCRWNGGTAIRIMDGEICNKMDGEIQVSWLLKDLQEELLSLNPLIPKLRPSME
jgi:hypothetical protein